MRNDEECGWGADKKLPSFLSQAPIKRIHDDLQFQNFQLRRWKINYIRIFMIALLSGSAGGDLQETQLPLCAFVYGPPYLSTRRVVQSVLCAAPPLIALNAIDAERVSKNSLAHLIG